MVHMVGGVAGFVDAIFVGPKIGRFVDGAMQPRSGYSETLETLGTFIILFSWFGFNLGSALKDLCSCFAVAERCAMTTTTVGAVDCITTLVVQNPPTTFSIRSRCLTVL